MALLDDDFSAGVLMRICRILGAPKVADLIDFGKMYLKHV